MTTVTPTEALMTVQDVAELAGISKSVIYKWRCEAPEKAPRAINIGRRVRFRRSDVDEWLESLTETR